VAIRAPPREGLHPVTPEKAENAENAGQNSQRGLNPQQQNPVAPHAPTPMLSTVTGSWRLA